MSRLLRSVLDILFGNLLLRLLGIVFTPLLVRALSKAEYGEFVGLLAIFQVVSRLSTGGLFQATNKYTAEVDAEGRGQILAGSLALSTIYSIVTGGAILGLIWWFGPVGFGESIFAYIAVLVVLVRNPFVVIRGFLYGAHEERFSQGLLVFWKGLYTMGALAVAYAGFGVVSIFVVYVVSYLLAVISGLGWGYRLVKSKISSLSFDSETTRQVGQFGGITIVGFMSTLLLYKTDILLIRYFLDDTLVAEYQAALFPAELVWVIPGAIQGALLQNTAGDWAEGRIAEVGETLKNGVKYGVMSLVLCGVGLFMLAKEFLFVYFGPDYVTSALLLQILLVGSIIYGINRVYVPVLQSIGELKRQQATNVVALLVNVVLNLLFIPRFGVLGAAVATTVSYASVILGSHLLLYFSPVQSPPMKLITKLLALFIAFAVLYGSVVTVVSLPPLQALLVFPALGIIVFGVLCHYLGLFSISDARRALSAL